MTISTAQARPAGRREWIDATKGLAIILVVMWHVEFWHYEVTRAWPPYLFPVIDLLKEVRMPLFFFISGYLIKGLLFRDGVKSWIRAGNLFFVYLFWGALVSLKQLLLLDDGFWEFAYRIALLVVSPSSFWYFWALAVFTLIARLAMSGGRWGLGILIGLSVAAYLFGQPYAISLDHTMRGVNIDSHFRGFVMNAIFFNMGVVMAIYASGTDQAGSRNSRILAALVAASGGLLIYAMGTSLPAATLVMGGLFVLAVMSIAPVAFDAGPVSSALGVLGRSTGYIYIFHPLYFTVASFIMPRLGLSLPDAPGWIDLSVLGNIVIALCGALVFKSILNRMGWQFLILGPYPERKT